MPPGSEPKNEVPTRLLQDDQLKIQFDEPVEEFYAEKNLILAEQKDIY